MRIPNDDVTKKNPRASYHRSSRVMMCTGDMTVQKINANNCNRRHKYPHVNKLIPETQQPVNRDTYDTIMYILII